MKKLLIVAFTSLFMIAGFAQTKVIIIPTLHSLHKSNALYNYDSIQSTIKKINPDVIVVEMRSMDVGEDTNYQKRNYPYEMWMMRYWFPVKTVEGFDWLGEELQGKQIPVRYWQDASRIKYLEKRLHIDSVYTEKLKPCELYTNERLKILKNSSLPQLLRSNDVILTKEYYDCLTQKLQGSDYEEISSFYDQRNQKMQENLGALIKKYSNKKIVVLTGDDHYPYLMDYLKKQGVQVRLPL